VVNRKVLYFVAGAGGTIGILYFLYVSVILSTMNLPATLWITAECIKGKTQNETHSLYCSNPEAIALSDSSLEQSPKLRDALLKTLAGGAAGGHGDMRQYSINMTAAEFNGMCRILLNAEGKPIQNPFDDPAQELWPHVSSIVFVAYNGNTFELVPDVYRLGPFAG